MPDAYQFDSADTSNITNMIHPIYWLNHPPSIPILISKSCPTENIHYLIEWTTNKKEIKPNVWNNGCTMGRADLKLSPTKLNPITLHFGPTFSSSKLKLCKARLRNRQVSMRLEHGLIQLEPKRKSNHIWDMMALQFAGRNNNFFSFYFNVYIYMKIWIRQP